MMGYSIVHILIMVVVVAACIGIVLIALKQFGVQVPDFVVRILWIVLCAIVAIVAI